MSDYAKNRDSGAFFAGNASFIEEVYARYRRHPDSVSGEWRARFAGFDGDGEVDHREIVDGIARRALLPRVLPGDGADDGGKQNAVHQLITQYRILGARAANINPLPYDKKTPPELDPATHGLLPSDMDSVFSTDLPGLERAKLSAIVGKIRAVYCGTIAPEFMHLSNGERRNWLRRRFEGGLGELSTSEKIRLLNRLTASEVLEKYLHTRYVGQKRFSLEGGDSLVPLLDKLLRLAGEWGVQESVIGMAHRGRLNVLVNILGKHPAELFREFEGKHGKSHGSGDVKYHMGFSSTWSTPGGGLHLALAFNPSHLEIVNPVVEGSVRARQDRRGDSERKIVLPIIIHGDAAFAGQGVIMEAFNFSQVRGFKTGGTVHIIVNNQIGFTTSTPDDARSTFFCSDAAKMVEAPIIHIHCDDIEGMAQATAIAFDYRQKFGADVVLDLVCFRRHGHNEQDEPLMTQPLMYQKIAKHPGSLAVYRKKLTADGVIGKKDADAIAAQIKGRLEKGEATSDDVVPTEKSEFVDWKKFQQDSRDWDWRPAKPFGIKKLTALAQKISAIPSAFSPHPQLKKLARQRREMADGARPLDWGMAENLGYATLLSEGVSVRLSGQDCGRGTFSHRHAVWHDQSRDKRDGGNYVPLRNLSDQQGDFLVIDSILSEEAVLGFEYGYATTAPNRLVIWEAQFGDFANGAQVVIDQFIASGEAKWGRYCGLVMLLPHGFEGQGPEHSSARLERYLQLCAEYNMQVCVPSSPAQIYHLLRRQILRQNRMPLIVITPKSLLRHPQATSTLAELSDGRFLPMIGESDENIKPAKVKRAVFCCGKIYYEVRAARRERKIDDIAIVRVEQLYPFPHDYLESQLKKYPNAKQVVWCQEEPGNQGAWHRLQHYFRRHIGKAGHLTYALRPSSASPATGRADLHKKQQQEVVDAALNIKSVV